MQTVADRLAHLDRPAAEVAAIASAIETYGGKAVHAACGKAYAGDKAPLAALLGIQIQTLGTVNAADTAAFDRLTPAERATDLRQAKADLAHIASALGRKGGQARSEAKTEAARANARKPRPRAKG